jgi:hypothetical protein
MKSFTLKDVFCSSRLRSIETPGIKRSTVAASILTKKISQIISEMKGESLDPNSLKLDGSGPQAGDRIH